MGVELDDQAAAEGVDVVPVPVLGCGQAGEQIFFEMVDRVFDGAVVAGIVRGAVEGNDQVPGEQVIDFVAVEVEELASGKTESSASG